MVTMKPYKITSDMKTAGTAYWIEHNIISKNGKRVCTCYSEKMADIIMEFLTERYFERKK